MLRFGTPENWLAATPFMPHGTCYLWQPGLVGLHLVSDAIIALSYFSIPLSLLHIARKRPDIPFNWLFVLFATFIISCGSGHLMDIWTLWHPDYWLSGYIRAVTAAVSLGTAYAIAYSTPKIVHFPSPAQMEEANKLLLAEVKERRRVEMQLQQEQQFFQALLENLSDGIVACNAEGELTLFNHATQTFHGLPQDETIPAEQWAQHYNLFHADGTTLMSKEEIPLFRALQGEILRDVEMTIAPNGGGQARAILASGSPIVTPEGKKLGAVVAMKDVSDRKATETALREREEFLRNIYNGVNLSIFVIDVTPEGEFRFVGFNPTHERLTGLRSQDIQGKTIEEIVPPESAATLRQHYINCVETGSTVTYEICLQYRGEETWWLSNLNPLRDANGRIYRIIGTSLNITQRKQMEAALRESEQRFYGAFEYAAIGMALVAPDGRWLKVNGALCELVGYSESELLAMDFQTITHPEDLETDLNSVRQLLNGEIRRYQMEKRYIHKSGHLVWISLHVSLVRDDRGQPLYLIAQIKNISDRKRAEIQLRESERRFRAIFNSTFQFMGLLQPDGTLLEANQTALDFGGLQAEDVIGRPFCQTPWWGDGEGEQGSRGASIAPEMLAPEMLAPGAGEMGIVSNTQCLSSKQEQLQDAIARAATGEFIRYEVDVRGAGDTVVTVDFSIKPVFDEDGQVVLLIPEGRDITEKKQAEEALRKNEERWQLALVGTGDGIFDWNIATNEVFLSPLLKEMLGYSDSELENTFEGWRQLLHPDDLDWVIKAVQAHLNREVPQYAVEYRLRCKDGSYKWILARGETKWDEMGKPLRMVGSHQDITARKQAEAALHESRERLQLALEASGDGLWDWNITTAEVYMSPQWFQMLDYKPGEIESNVKTWESLIHPSDKPWVMELLDAHLKDSSIPYFFDYRMRTRSGQWKWIGNYGKVVTCDADGNPLRMVGTHKDVSDRKHAEAQLLESLERYQLLANSSSDLIATQTLDGAYLYVSPACRRLLDYEPEDLIGRSFYEFLHPEDSAALQQTRALVNQFPEQYTQSFRMRRRDGSYVWLETTNKVSNAPDYNNLQVVVSIARDISDRKQAEAALVALNQQLEQELIDRRSKLKAISRLYRSVINSVKEVIFQTDKTGRWIFLSPAWTEISGFTIEESLNTPLLDYIYALKDQQRLTALFQDLIALKRDSFRCEFRCPTKGGGFRWLEMYASAEEAEENGAIVGTYGTLNDITERKQAEAILKSRADELAKQQQQIHLQNLELQQASQLKSEFLATMSHELRTPLNAIMGFSQLLQLQQYGTLAPRQKDMVDRIFNNSQNLLEMLNEVLDFSKIEAGRWQIQPEPVDLNTLTRLTVEELRSLAQKKNLEIEVCCQLENPKVFNDPSAVRRILANLISNAIKFTESGGITVEVEEMSENRIGISVRDTGIGISAEELNNIFEAFRQVDQTLTRQHSGTGLGLAITQSLVEMMQGAIAVESEVGVGTTFRVEFPRTVEQ